MPSVPLTSYDIKRNDKRELAIMWIREAKAAADCNYFQTVLRITKDLASGRDSDPVKDVDGRQLIHDDEHLKRWKECSTSVLTALYSVKFRFFGMKVTITGDFGVSFQMKEKSSRP